MSNLQNHAERELKLAGYYDKDSDYGGMIPEAVLELMGVFSKQGHSGMSASLVRNIFNRLADFKNLTLLTGKDDEWNDIGETLNKSEKNEMYQNNRVGSVFKDGKDEQAYYSVAIVFQGEESHDSFTGSVGEIRSRQYVKSFPFTPKTFRIDVLKEYYDGKPEETKEYYEEDKTDGTKKYYKYIIKDEKQLEEVYEYYDKDANS